MEQPNELQLPPEVKPIEEEARKTHEAIQRARAGDPMAIAPVREFLRSKPAAALMLGGDLSWEAVSLLVRDYAGKNLAVREALYQQMDNLRMELSGPGRMPSGIERLLIENVVGTWLHLHRLEVLYAAQEKPTFATDSFFQKELSAAHKRYLAAMRSLIDARRRPLPNVQINVANEQVNIATNEAPPTG